MIHPWLKDRSPKMQMEGYHLACSFAEPNGERSSLNDLGHCTLSQCIWPQSDVRVVGVGRKAHQNATVPTGRCIKRTCHTSTQIPQTAVRVVVCKTNPSHPPFPSSDV